MHGVTKNSKDSATPIVVLTARSKKHSKKTVLIGTMPSRSCLSIESEPDTFHCYLNLNSYGVLETMIK